MTNGFFRNIVGAWSLEKKCLIFLGLALLISMLLSTSVIQVVAARLVMETTRRSARDFGESVFLIQHAEAFVKLSKPSSEIAAGRTTSNQSASATQTAQPTPSKATDESTDDSDDQLGQLDESIRDNNLAVLNWLRKDFLPSETTFELLRLDDGREYDDLGGLVPKSEADLRALYRIEADLKAEEDADALARTTDPIDQIPAGNSDLDPSPKKQPADSQDKPSVKNQIQTEFGLAGPNSSSRVFQEYGPIGEFYYYYYPVTFSKYCVDCHAIKNSRSLNAASELPFRVLRVKMPYADTWLWTIWSYAIVTAVALATLALSLFFVHWILKRLVIRPLRYLRDVSDEVSRGNLTLRSEIDTDDEFYELSEAFNRMLRHLTEAQVELKDVNQVLDKRVDQLAQVNLQLYEANRLKSDFLASMSHELRTPLNSILGFSDVLQGFDTLTDKQKRYAANIQKSGRLLLEMINDILDLAKVEAGKMEVRPTRFDFIHLVESQCDVIRKLADDKNIDLQIEIDSSIALPSPSASPVASPVASSGTAHENQPTESDATKGSQPDSSDDLAALPGKPEMILVQDQTKLLQILTNLLSNAIKFTPQGGIIRVAVTDSGLDKNGVEGFSFAVIDTGVGIAEHDHEAIFEKFRQINSSQDGDALTREYSGTGLGLSIVRELCRLLGGEIQLSSQLGRGSSFTVTLPKQYSQPIKEETAAKSIVDNEMFIAAPH
jgi:signal transduction histidine kinase